MTRTVVKLPRVHRGVDLKSFTSDILRFKGHGTWNGGPRFQKQKKGDVMVSLLYVLLCTGVGYMAVRWGRSGTIFFLISIFFSPIIGFIVLLLMPYINGEKKL